MFSRKKQTGNVKFIEEDDDLSDRAKLLGNQLRTAYVSESERTNDELNDMLVKEAKDGTLETERALKSAIETRDTGRQIAVSLHEQTKQLEKNSEDLSTIHGKLDEAEGLIHKIKTPKLLRIFRRKPKTGQGLKKAEASKAEKKERKKLQEKGVESLGLLEEVDEGEGEEQSKSEEDIPVVSQAADSKRRNLFGKRKKQNQAVRVSDIKEDYSEYDSSVAEALIEQDKNLEIISDVVQETAELAKAMSYEIAAQEGLIDQVQAEVNATKERTSKIAGSVMEN